MTVKPRHEPDAAEIARECEAIRQGWTERERRLREVVKESPWCVPRAGCAVMEPKVEE